MRVKQHRGLPSGSPLLFGVMASLVLFAGAMSGALASQPKDWDKDLKKGNQMLSSGQTEQAIEFFRAKVRKNPTSGACHTALGVALRRLGKSADAKTELKQATEVDPDYSEGFLEYGKALESDRDFENAAQSFEKYNELNPDSGQRKAISDRITYCRNQKQ